MSKRIPIILPSDLNGRVIPKFMDCFEAVRFNMTGEPKYYGYMNPDGDFVIVQHSTVSGDEHLMFYRGDMGETLAGKWAVKDTLTYVEYDEAY